MSLQDRFQKAADSVKSFTKRPSDDELLYTYSLYKQATIGDINIPEPSFFQFEQKSK